MCAGVALTADVVVMSTIGPNWSGVVDPLRVLSLYAAMIVSQVLVSQVLVWTGQFRANMWINMLSLVVTPAAAFIGAQYSITGVAWALVIGWAPAALPGVFVALRTMRVRWTDYVQSMWPATAGCAIMAVVVMGVRALLPEDLRPIVSLTIQSLSGAVVYLAVFALLFRHRLRTLYQLIRAARGGSSREGTPGHSALTPPAVPPGAQNRPSGGATS